MSNYIYEVIPENAETFTPSYIKRTDEDGKVWSIPADPSNSDYQAYLNPQETVPSNSSIPQAGE